MLAAVVERWGAEVAPEGRVDRAAIAASPSRTTTSAHFLESLLWPRVGARVARWRRTRGGDAGPRALVVETPLLFEAGLEGKYDATIAIVADEAVRAERAAPAGMRRSTNGPPDS